MVEVIKEVLMLDLVDQVVVVVPVTLLLVLVELLQDLEQEMPVVLVEDSHLMLVVEEVVVPVVLVKQDPEVHNMVDMVVLVYKHLQHLDLLLLVLVYMDLHMVHHLVVHGLLAVVVEEEETLQELQEVLEVDQDHLFNQIILDGLVQELEVVDHMQLVDME